jgi:multiple sugar transport system permease protein
VVSRMKWYEWTERLEPVLYILPAFVLLLLVVIWPVIYGTIVAFFQEGLPTPQVFVGLKNFLFDLNDTLYVGSISTSLIYSFSSITCSFLLGLVTALVVHSITWGKGVFRVLLIIPMMVAPLVVGLTWRWMLDPIAGAVNWMLGLLHLPEQVWLSNTGTAMAAVVGVDVWEWYPLVFLIIYAGLSGLPVQPFEAAQLDGASPWMIFRRITLPMLKPVLLVALILRTADAFRAFDSIHALTDGGPTGATETMSHYIWRLAFRWGVIPKAGAGAMIMLFMIAIVTAFMFRFLSEDSGPREAGKER